MFVGHLGHGSVSHLGHRGSVGHFGQWVIVGHLGQWITWVSGSLGSVGLMGQWVVATRMVREMGFKNSVDTLFLSNFLKNLFSIRTKTTRYRNTRNPYKALNTRHYMFTICPFLISNCLF